MHSLVNIQQLIQNLNVAVGNKADKSTTDELSALVTNKADRSELGPYATNVAIALKADKVYVDTKLDLKANVASTLAGYGILDAYTSAQVDARIATVVGTAPANLDTLQEIATQLANDESAVSSLVTTVASKANTTDVNTALALKADKTTTDSLTTSLNSKQATIVAGTTAQYYRGDKTWVDFATSVRAAVLTGFTTTASNAVVAADNILVAIGKLQGQLNAIATAISDAIVGERSEVATLTNKTLVEPVIKNYTEFSYSGPVAGAVDVDLANGTLQKLTLTANTTITLPPSVNGKSYTLVLAYNGAFVPTFVGGSILKWSNQVAPPAKSVAGFMDIFVFTCDGTNTLGRSGGSNF